MRVPHRSKKFPQERKEQDVSEPAIFPFLALPGEVRNKIYALISHLVPPHPLKTRHLTSESYTCENPNCYCSKNKIKTFRNPFRKQKGHLRFIERWEIKPIYKHLHSLRQTCHQIRSATELCWQSIKSGRYEEYLFLQPKHIQIMKQYNCRIIRWSWFT
ncbi:hypothetical protein EJ08DRAFT_108545 [Tothia fuscella]|uniref:Uncharacterized protein n=1 Tax=Tothia fuscella TaxID=1048955 RepID=A0A9P4NVZ1_9PEZI|nr:hypothetical protein EJ08DRAFT_108545 [Tothia fuscella]